VTMEKERPIFILLAIFTIAWLLVLVGSAVIFEFIVPFHYWGGFTDRIAKGVFATVLGLVWLYALALLRNLLVRRTIPTRNKSAISSQV
jgi:pilus assembly protein TadC